MTQRLMNANSGAQSASLQVKESAGTLFGLTVYNNNAGAQFIQLHDAATAPADTAVPAIVFAIPTQTTCTLDLGRYGRRFASGIYACNSSTDVTKTIGAADCIFDAQYE